MYIKDPFHDCQKQATNEPELLSHTRQYICKELITTSSTHKTQEGRQW